MERRHQLVPTTNHSSLSQQRSHERHDLARRGTRRLEMDSMEGNSVSSGLAQQMRPTTPIATTTTTKPTTVGHTQHATEPHDHDEDDDDDTIRPLPTGRKLIFKKTKAPTINKSANSAPATLCDASQSHLHFQRRYRSTSFQLARYLSRIALNTCVCMMRTLRQTGNGPSGDVRAVYRELTGRVAQVFMTQGCV